MNVTSPNSPKLLKKLLSYFPTPYQPVLFETNNKYREITKIYHTDLILNLGEKYAIVCSEAIKK